MACPQCGIGVFPGGKDPKTCSANYWEGDCCICNGSAATCKFCKVRQSVVDGAKQKFLDSLHKDELEIALSAYDEVKEVAGKQFTAYLEGQLRKEMQSKEWKTKLVTSKRWISWLASEQGSVCRPKGRLDCSGLMFKEMESDLSLFNGILTHLDISHNHAVERLPIKSLSGVRSLQSLECKDCPELLSPPPEIAEQGGETVMHFIREVCRSGEINTEMLLFLIGDGEAGKTSTLKAMMSAHHSTTKIDQDERTVGINVTRWTSKADELTFTVLDLAGQPVYLASHQFFLAHRACYLLCWRARNSPVEDLKDDLAEERIMVERWLDLLQHRVPGVPVVLVCTHKDVAASKEALQMQVRLVQEAVEGKVREQGESAKAGIRPLRVLRGGESVCVNNLSGEGVAALRGELMAFARGLRWYGEALPEAWMRLQGRLRRMQEGGETWLDWRTYAALAAECEVEGPMLATATTFLHETGKLRYFGDVQKAQCASVAALERDLMLSTVFISPVWMIDVLKGLVRHSHSALSIYFDRNNPRGFIREMGKADGAEMSRRVRRLVVFGILHETLLPFLWPALESRKMFWSEIIKDPDEAGMWGGRQVVRSAEDVGRAVGLLAGFNVMARCSPSEFVVPGLQASHRAGVVAAGAFNAIDCPFYSTYQFVSIPPGAWEGMVVSLRKQTVHADVSPTQAAFYKRGSKVLLFQAARGLPKGVGAELTLRASAKDIWDMAKREVDRMLAFFPGLPVIGLRETSASELPRGQVAVHCLWLCSSQTSLLRGSEVYATEGTYTSTALQNQVEEGLNVAEEEGEAQSAEECVWDLVTGSVASAEVLAVVTELAGELLEANEKIGNIVESRSSMEDGQTFKLEVPFNSSEIWSTPGGPSVKSRRRRLSYQEMETAQSIIVECKASAARPLIEHVKDERPVEEILADAAEGDSLWPMEQIAALLHELDPSIAMDFTSLSRATRVLGRVVVVCVDESIRSCKKTQARLQELEEQNCALVPIILPGYVITNFTRWWPETLPELKRHSLFVDMRDPSLWRHTVRNELLPQIVRYLEEWHGNAPHAARGHAGKASSAEDEPIECLVCLREQLPPHQWKRGWLLQQQEEWMARQLERRSMRLDKESELEVECSNGHWQRISEVLSSAAVQEALPCPACVAANTVPPFCFQRKTCLLYFEEGNDAKIGALHCEKCASAGRSPMVRVLDVLIPEVFISYSWGHKNRTQLLVKKVHKRVEMLTDLVCWLDVSGGLGAGKDFLEEMMNGIKRATVVVIFFSDSYLNSENCRREIMQAIRSCKYIIPVLLPDLGMTPKGSSGWTGSGEAREWVRHAEQACTNGVDPDTGIEIPWSVLEQFAPIDIRDEVEEGLIPEDSWAENEIVRRVLGRFHRGGLVEHQTRQGYAAWASAKQQFLNSLGLTAALGDQSLEERIEEVFHEIDANSSGEVDAGELRAMLLAKNIQVGDQELQQMMAAADLDYNGTIELGEFQVLIKNLIAKPRRGSTLANLSQTPSTEDVAAAGGAEGADGAGGGRGGVEGGRAGSSGEARLRHYDTAPPRAMLGRAEPSSEEQKMAEVLSGMQRAQRPPSSGPSAADAGAHRPQGSPQRAASSGEFIRLRSPSSAISTPKAAPSPAALALRLPLDAAAEGDTRSGSAESRPGHSASSSPPNLLPIADADEEPLTARTSGDSGHSDASDDSDEPGRAPPSPALEGAPSSASALGAAAQLRDDSAASSRTSDSDDDSKPPTPPLAQAAPGPATGTADWPRLSGSLERPATAHSGRPSTSGGTRPSTSHTDRRQVSWDYDLPPEPPEPPLASPDDDAAAWPSNLLPPSRSSEVGSEPKADSDHAPRSLGRGAPRRKSSSDSDSAASERLPLGGAGGEGRSPGSALAGAAERGREGRGAAEQGPQGAAQAQSWVAGSGGGMEGQSGGRGARGGGSERVLRLSGAGGGGRAGPAGAQSPPRGQSASPTGRALSQRAKSAGGGLAGSLSPGFRYGGRPATSGGGGVRGRGAQDAVEFNRSLSWMQPRRRWFQTAPKVTPTLASHYPFPSEREARLWQSLPQPGQGGAGGAGARGRDAWRGAVSEGLTRDVWVDAWRLNAPRDLSPTRLHPPPVRLWAQERAEGMQRRFPVGGAGGHWATADAVWEGEAAARRARERSSPEGAGKQRPMSAVTGPGGGKGGVAAGGEGGRRRAESAGRSPDRPQKRGRPARLPAGGKGAASRLTRQGLRIEEAVLSGGAQERRGREAMSGLELAWGERKRPALSSVVAISSSPLLQPMGRWRSQRRLRSG